MNNVDRDINEITSKFRSSFGSLKGNELNWKPDPESWSIGQNVEHLIVTNRSYFPVFDSLLTGSNKVPFIARFGFLVSLSGRMILNSVQPDRKRKVKTFPIWKPTGSRVNADIIDEFERHQEELKRQITSVEEAVGLGAVISSPANRYIVYSMGNAVEIILAHEHRHFEQCMEVWRMMGGSKDRSG